MSGYKKEVEGWKPGSAEFLMQVRDAPTYEDRMAVDKELCVLMMSHGIVVRDLLDFMMNPADISCTKVLKFLNEYGQRFKKTKKTKVVKCLECEPEI